MSQAPVALVTGAGQGVGRAIACRLDEAGYRLALVGRNADTLDQTAAMLTGPALPLAADLTEPEGANQMFDQLEDVWGHASIMVANAGASLAGPIAQINDADWQHMIDINMSAPFRCIRRALPSMVAAGFGRIVLIASIVAKRGERGVSAYTASKHGALGLIRAVADEVARTGVTANAVCPGYVNTPMTQATINAIAERRDITTDEAQRLLARRQPIGRLIEPAEVADAAWACIANAAINGQGINVDGGAVQS